MEADTQPPNGCVDLAEGLLTASHRLAALTVKLDDIDREDGRQALSRALNNLLGRAEFDKDAPELVPFNGWGQKFFMDNPCYRYWITDIRGGADYRICGNIGDSVYQSITAYSGRGVADAVAELRIDRADLTVSATGDFDTVLTLPGAVTSLWVRYTHEVLTPPQPGWCRIERVGPHPGTPLHNPGHHDRELARVGGFIAHLPGLWEMATADDAKVPNSVRHWAAMAGGAAFTEPGVHYLRGSWQLEPGEALLIDGPAVACRNWNVVLYNRFLNSLDYRTRTVAHTSTTAPVSDGRYRFAIADRDPGIDGQHWLDTGGRRFGLFVLRFLQPESEPELPVVRRVVP
jgi:hypothetical protein